jgi:hypothetical protein
MNLNSKAEQRAAKRERIEKAMETTYSSYHSPKMVADKIIAAREAEQPVTDMQEAPAAIPPLLVHVTDGGAVYVTDNHDFKEAGIIIRIDNHINLDPEETAYRITLAYNSHTELLQALEGLLAPFTLMANTLPPEQFEDANARILAARAALAEAKGVRA